MRSRRTLLLAGAVLVAGPFASFKVWKTRSPETIGVAGIALAQDAAKFDGRASFQTNCAFCHGKTGKGDGNAAYLLHPKPRDFTRGLFKIRSTHAGEMPSDDDLFRVITDGVPGSAMLAWGWMPEGERRALVEEVKRLSVFYDEDAEETVNWFARRGKGTPIEVTAEPETTPRSIALGKEVYFRVGCQKCHGNEGKGDGPSSVGLKDDWGFPILPRNFTTGAFKGGSTNKDLYVRTLVGMEGTPMPAFGKETMTDAERWALVHFVRALTQRPADHPVLQSVPGELLVKKIAAVPTDPEDARWESVPALDLPLIQLFQGGRGPEVLTVRAAHDGKQIAWVLDWKDSSINSQVLRVQDFRDGAAIQFAVKGPSTPLMGDPEKPVNIWHWKADWQSDLGEWKDVEQAYPGMQTDHYPQTRGDQTTGFAGRPSSGLSTDKPFVTGHAAGNPMSEQRRKSPVEDLNARGFGTLTSQAPALQNVRGSGAWMGGHWRVVFVRDLVSPDPDDAKFASGDKVTVSFAAWDGALRDRDGQKSVTTWYTAKVE